METSITRPFKPDSFEKWKELFDALYGQLGTYLRGKFTVSAWSISPVFSSWWLKHLHERGILVDPKDELDWSGRGQHIEYDADEESVIPLQTKKVLGYSPTAIVESVQCRRILLARKTVKCTRRLTKENAVTEVEHLQKVQHSHIVRVVGTYTIRKALAILIYPVADQNLEELMDDVVDLDRDDPRHAKVIMPTFFGCLSRAVTFIHGKNVKHMDIKPKNILVRQSEGNYKVYVADFGIARSYKSAAESFTDNPTSYTRTYAAPEVVMQDIRGYPADVFSLGCVFMEMLASMVSSPKSDQRDNLATIRGIDYQSNTEAVLAWYHYYVERRWSDEEYLPLNRHADDPFFQALQRTLSRLPEVRPLAIDLQRFTSELCCSACGDGPEPFEASIDSA
ncbi:kinase-like domain-containing protein [Paraphoma chrysanthemicola]|uniref:Kinase-like domain-containing protein n=1 Tax=Paraphoma chrysanthemicola TaxID=798071 RepID=A0A8K0QW93_9PLEO|nr:kinase-like domain-containing protein [Paraphoma chrysanthemicola]